MLRTNILIKFVSANSVELEFRPKWFAVTFVLHIQISDTVMFRFSENTNTKISPKKLTQFLKVLFLINFRRYHNCFSLWFAHEKLWLYQSVFLRKWRWKYVGNKSNLGFRKMLNVRKVLKKLALIIVTRNNIVWKFGP